MHIRATQPIHTPTLDAGVLVVELGVEHLLLRPAHRLQHVGLGGGMNTTTRKKHHLLENRTGPTLMSTKKKYCATHLAAVVTVGAHAQADLPRVRVLEVMRVGRVIEQRARELRVGVASGTAD